jgi:small subunit ribosomal protein S3
MDQSKILQQKIKEFEIQEFVAQNLKGVGLSSTKLVLTPLGEKIVVAASRPGLVVGRKGQSIKKLTSMLKKRFNLENPQIEISEVENINLDPQIVSERIANSLERFGLSRFKGVGHKTMEDVMNAGALGIEIIISGKVPSARAKRWRFYQGYLKKCGQVAIEGVRTAYTTAQLKTGTIGIVVKIMPPNLVLPDDITIVESLPTAPAEAVAAPEPAAVEAAAEEPKKPKKKTVRKKKKDESEGTSKE